MSRTEYARQVKQELYGEQRSAVEGTDPEFSAIKERLVYGEIYPHIHLDAKLRELLILAVATTNQTMGEVSVHTQAALQAGADPGEIREAVYHCAPYIGLGKAEQAVRVVDQVLEQRGIQLPLERAGTVTEENRLEKGLSAQKAIFGESIDAMRAAAPEDQKHIQDYLTAYCFGDFYTRGHLDLKQRELLTFCILCAQGGCENQVRAHIGGNAAVGNGKAVLLDALTVCLPYVGFPRTLNALSCLNEVLPEPQKESLRN